MYNIGIDLGGTNIAVGLVNEKFEIIKKASLPTKKERECHHILEDMIKLVSKVMDDATVQPKDVSSIGCGSPGIVDAKCGAIIYANNLKFKNFELGKGLEKYFKIPVFAENDANCAAIAESVAGAAKGYNYSITITIGTGIGSGVIIDKKVYRGFNYAAPEFGHMVVEFNGKQCTCGRKGCWERYASANAVIEQTKEALNSCKNSAMFKGIEGNLENINAKTAFDYAKENDEVAKKIVEKYIFYLSEGLVNIVNMLQPDVIVIGGGLSKEGDYLLNPVRKHIAENTYSGDKIPNTRLEIAQMGNDAGIIGAAMLELINGGNK